jgi:hypothetical protein
MFKKVKSRFPALAVLGLALLIIVPILPACGGGGSGEAESEAPFELGIDPGPMTTKQIKERIALFAPVKITYDESVLSEAEKSALAKIVEAAQIIDEIFLRQAWAGNLRMRSQLKTALEQVQSLKATNDQRDYVEALYHFYRINVGPWDRVNENEPVYGSNAKPLGAGFYPENMTKDEFNNHLEANPADQEAFQGFFTMIVREYGTLKATPYSQAFMTLLQKAGTLQREAADILTAPNVSDQLAEGVDYTTFARFLRSRAAAYMSDDYYQSDMDWMDVENNIIDATIGPYEVYEDLLFGYKAAFEAFIAIRNPADSKKLDGLKGYMQAMENNLPIPDNHKNPNRGSESPISVVDVVYGGGDANAGVQTIAFNLPNDERVREAKGSKKVMLKNISRAKFDKILIPIAKTILDPAQLEHVEFDIFFSNTLMHEFSHGVGPGNITLADGRKSTVGLELKDTYSIIEEAKADILGLYNTEFLVGEGYFPKEQQAKAYITFLPGFFRAIRFGIHAAHGGANMIEFNFMAEQGAIVFDPATEKFTVMVDKMPASVRKLSTKLLMIEALGDYEAAKELITKYGTMSPEVEKLIEKFNSIPTDIEPIYKTEKYSLDI